MPPRRRGSHHAPPPLAAQVATRIGRGHDAMFPVVAPASNVHRAVSVREPANAVTLVVRPRAKIYRAVGQVSLCALAMSFARVMIALSNKAIISSVRLSPFGRRMPTQMLVCLNIARGRSLHSGVAALGPWQSWDTALKMSVALAQSMPSRTLHSMLNAGMLAVCTAGLWAGGIAVT